MKTVTMNRVMLLFCLAMGVQATSTFSAPLLSQAPGKVTGKVVDQQGRPVGCINVYTGLPNDFHLSVRMSRQPVARANSDGEFNFTIPPRQYMLYAYDEERGFPNLLLAVYSYGNPKSYSIFRMQSGAVRDFLITLPPKAARLELLVVDQETEKPIAGAALDIRIWAAPEVLLGRTASDIQGIPTENLLPAEVDLKLTIQADGYKSQAFSRQGSERVRFGAGEKAAFVVKLKKR